MRALNKLTDRGAKALTEIGRHSDGGGLYLVIHKNGGRSWSFLFRQDGRQRELGIGPANAMTLKRAREIAAGHRAKLAEGIAPEGKRSAAKGSMTFGVLAAAYVEAHEASWRSVTHRAQWRDTLRVHAAPLTNLPVEKIDTEAVLTVLRPLWADRRETADRLRGRIERILDNAKARGLRSGENPARWRGHLEQLLPRRQRLEKEHHAAMPYAALPAFLERLRADGSMAARALEFAILTAARTSEVRFAAPGEIDLNAKIWTVAAIRMKSGRHHVVPLSDRALEIASEAMLHGGPWLFPGHKQDAPLGKTSMELVLSRIETESTATVHGFRSTFRDWCGDLTDYPRDVAEAALGHVVGSAVEQAYRRQTALTKRRALMDAWANYCAATNVIPLRKVGA